MRSCLTDREQSVTVNGAKSEPANITCGVPQGNILGPRLSFLNVSDMKETVNCILLLYADVSALMVSGKYLANIELVLSVDLKKVIHLCIGENRYSLAQRENSAKLQICM